MATEKEKRRYSLEREVILAVLVLYGAMSLILLAIHYLQPEGTTTVTSSPSPAHEHFSVPAPEGQ
ncbi:MAG: hypothetical protein M3O22_01900 [Pseudomonadota bacterium]|nr:hypothetical protein [Pseudomonadota bacterium]